MSENILRAGLDSSGYEEGARRVTKANLDIENSTKRAGSAISSIEGNFARMATGSLSSTSAAARALLDLQAPIKSISDHIRTLEERFLRIGVTIAAFAIIGATFKGVTSFVRDSIKAVDDYQLALVSITATLMQIAVINNELNKSKNLDTKSMPQMYLESAKYAEVLAEKMREVDINSVASYDQILQMLQVYTTTGHVLNVNNSRQMAGFTALSNAIPMMTTGQDKLRQMTTEMRALSTGSTVAGATIARAMDAMIKVDKVNGDPGGLKAFVAKNKNSGKDILELLEPFLQGYTATIPAIAMTLTTATTSFQTAFGAMQRKAFTPIVSDLVAIVKGLTQTAKDSGDAVSNIVQGAWIKVRGILFTVRDVTSDIGLKSKEITLKPEILDGLLSVGNVLLKIGNVLGYITLKMITHADDIVKLAAAYGIFKVAVLSSYIIHQAHNAIMVIKNKLTAEDIDLTIAETLARNNAIITAGKEMTANAAATEAQELRNASIIRGNKALITKLEASILMESALIKETTANMAANAAALQMAEANVVAMGTEVNLAKSRQLAATAEYERNYAMNATRAFNAESAAVEAMAHKELLLAEENLALAEVNLASKKAYNIELNGILTTTTNSVTASQVKLSEALYASQLPGATAAALRHNTALASVGITTGAVAGHTIALNRATFMGLSPWDQYRAKLIAASEAITINTVTTKFGTAQQALYAIGASAVGTSAFSAAFSMARYTVSMVATTVATYAAAAATAVLNGALALVGGWLGVIVIAIAAAIYWWNSYTNAQEAAMKKAQEGIKTDDEIIAGLKAKKELTEKLAEIADKRAKTPAGAIADLTPEQKILENLGTNAEMYIRLGKEAETSKTKIDALNKSMIGYRGGNDGLNKILEVEQTKYDNRIRQQKELIAISEKVVVPKSIPGTGDLTGKKHVTEAKEWLDNYNSYLRAHNADIYALEKAHAASMQTLLDEDLRSGAITKQTYLDRQYLAQQQANSNDLALAKQQMADMLETRDAYFKQIGVSEAEMMNSDGSLNKSALAKHAGTKPALGTSDEAKASMDAYNKRVTENEKMIGYEKSLDDAKQKVNLTIIAGTDLVNKYGIASKVNAEEIIKSQESINIEYLKVQGNELAAYEAQQNTLEVTKERKVVLDRLAEAQDRYTIELFKGNVDGAKSALLVINATETQIEQKEKLVMLGKVIAQQNQQTALDTINDATKDLKTSAIGDPFDQKNNELNNQYIRDMKSIEMQQEKLNAMKGFNDETIKLQEALNQKMLALDEKYRFDSEANKKSRELSVVDSIYDQAKKTYPKLIAMDAAYNQAKKIYATDYAAREKALIAAGVDAETAATKTKLSMTSDYASLAGSIFSGLAALQDTSSRQGFESAKELNAAACLMNTAASIMMAYAQLGPIAGSVAAVGLAALGMAQLNIIESTTFGGGGGNVPSGSFGATQGAGAGSGIGYLAVPLTSVEDSKTEAALLALAAGSNNIAVTLGRLSTAIDKLGTMYDSGSGLQLANNAPNKFKDLVTDPTYTKQFTNSVGNTIGAVLPTILLGPLALLSGSFLKNISSLGKNLGSMLFGWGNKWNVSDAGMALSVQNGQVNADDFTKEKKKGGLFGGSDKYRMGYSDNADVTDYMNGMLSEFVNGINRMALTLGTSADIEKYNQDITNISTSGRTTEEIAKDLKEWTARVLSGMALTVEGLQDVIGSYDDAYTMLIKYNNALVSTNMSLQLIGKETVQGSLVNARAVDALQTLMGGMESFGTAVETYFTTMFTEAEQKVNKAAVATTQVNQAFAEMGISVPKTRKGFRDLVNSLDITTTYGAETFAALMNISTAFGVMTDAIAESITKMTTLIIDNALAAANGIKEILNSGLSNESPGMKYARTQAAFTLATDANAVELGKAFLEASRDKYASTTGYDTDYNTVMNRLMNIAGISEISKVDQQITLLTSIQDALTTGPLITALSSLTEALTLGNISVTYASLPAFADGGITNGLSYAGEAGPEAVIPLPDGRTVPVTINGTADNANTDLLIEQNNLLREVIAKLTDIESPLRRVASR